MGMYSHMRLEYRLRADTPENTIKALGWLLQIDPATGKEDLRSEETFDSWSKCPYGDGHPFFDNTSHHKIGEDYMAYRKDGKWSFSYLPDVEGKTWTAMKKQEDGTWHVTVSTAAKPGEFLTQFCQWLSPWSIVREKVGLLAYEETWYDYYYEVWSDGQIDSVDITHR